ncbi:MAG: LLM class F420-dependent oxidoreductase [Acidimicrobiia bacterium]
MTQQRWGITVPFAGVPLSEHRSWFEELVDLGFTDIWSSEAGGHDAFTVLALAAAWTPGLRLGQAVVPVYTRGPALLAQTIASLIDAAPGRVAVGIGTSSNVIVERWNGIPFDRPYHHVRDTLRFLRTALTGEKVTATYDSFEVKGFRLGVRVEQQPPILVGALRPGMLRLAGREGDGAIINWLGADDVQTVAPIVAEGGADKEIVARIFVLPSEDRDAVRHLGRQMIAEYLNVPVYAAFHEWLGRGDLLGPMWTAWKAGDRAGATEAIPDEVLDQLVVSGSPEECAEHVTRYVEAGVTTPMPMILAAPDRTREVLRALAPK